VRRLVHVVAHVEAASAERADSSLVLAQLAAWFYQLALAKSEMPHELDSSTKV